MTALWITLTLIGALAGIVAICDHFFGSGRAGRSHQLQSEQEARRREFVAAAVVRKRRW